MRPNIFRDAIAGLFKSQPNTWIDAETLMQVGGRMAWRTRTSECRRQLGMRISNRTRKVGRRTVSEYMYHPAVPLKESARVQQRLAL